MSDWEEQGSGSEDESSRDGWGGDSGDAPAEEPGESAWDETLDQPHEGEEGQQPV